MAGGGTLENEGAVGLVLFAGVGASPWFCTRYCNRRSLFASPDLTESLMTGEGGVSLVGAMLSRLLSRTLDNARLQSSLVPRLREPLLFQDSLQVIVDERPRAFRYGGSHVLQAGCRHGWRGWDDAVIGGRVRRAKGGLAGNSAPERHGGCWRETRDCCGAEARRTAGERRRCCRYLRLLRSAVCGSSASGWLGSRSPQLCESANQRRTAPRVGEAGCREVQAIV